MLLAELQGARTARPDFPPMQVASLAHALAAAVGLGCSTKAGRVLRQALAMLRADLSRSLQETAGQGL